MVKKRTVRKFFLFFLLLIPIVGLAHYFIFPQETNCILLPFSSLKRSGNVYYDKNLSPLTLDKIRLVKSIAEKKDSLFWKENALIDYKLIYCNTETDFNKYAPPAVPAATHMKLGAYVVVKQVSVDENIMAHEISHTILYRNIGWYKRMFAIPTWFDEGLAMQVDDRDYYSIDSLLAKQKSGVILPDVTKMEKREDFFSGNEESIMLNYSTAKFIVHQWLKEHSLQKFIEDINKGIGFGRAYQQR